MRSASPSGCWEDPERASALLDDYNTRFNSLVLRDYSRSARR